MSQTLKLISLIALFWVVSAMPQKILASDAMTAFNKKDYNEAYRIWRRSPDSTESQYGIGRLFFEGLGGERDTSKGLQLLNTASARGYSPASEYLAGHFEKSRNYRAALKYLERLKSRGNSSELQSRILTAYSNLEKKPLTGSQNYCGALKELNELSRRNDEAFASDMQACALAGNPSTMTRQEALAKAASKLEERPSFEGLKLVARAALDPKSSKFDPESIEEAMWRLDPELTSNELKRTLVNAGVSFETCSSLPFSTDEEKRRVNSYCTLAGVAGAERAIKVLALDYAYGRKGRSINLGRASALINLSASARESKEGFLIILNNLIEKNDEERHLQKLIASKELMTSLSESDLRAQFAYQVRAAGEKGYDQSKAADLIKAANITKDSVIHKATFQQTKNAPKNPFADHDEGYITALCELERKIQGSEKECRSDSKGKEPVAQEAIAALTNNISSQPSPKQAVTPKTAGVSKTESSPKVPAAQMSPPGAMPNPDQALLKCDQGQLDFCAETALALMSNYPPRDYVAMPLDARRSLAIKKLERGVEGEAVSSLAMLYDIYTDGLDSALREKAKPYLEILTRKNTAEGRLRESISVFPKDPLSGGFGLILQRDTYRDACNSIKIQIERKELTRYDEIRAREYANGIICSSF
jgi:TPR repeat protein